MVESPRRPQGLRLVRLRLRLAWRRAVDEAFVLLVLGPLIVLPTWWIVERYLDLARGLAARALTTAPLLAAIASAGLVAVVLWPAARRDAASGVEPAGAETIGATLLAPQPIARGARRLADLAAASVRALLPAVVLLAAARVLATPDASGDPSIGPLPLGLGTSVTVVAGSLGVSWLVLALALWTSRPGRPGRPSRPIDRPTDPARRRDGRRAAASRLDGPVVALWRRDLRQVLRGAPAVPTAVLCALVALGAAALSVGDATLDPLLRRRLVVLFALLAVLCQSAIAPFLAAAQLPRLWLERSSGASLLAPARAKALLALCLAIMPSLLGLVLVALLPDPAPLRLAAAGQILLGATMLATVLGLGIYEIPEQPLLGFVFTALAGSALAGLVLFFPRAWWLWAIGWAWLVSQLAERSALRLRFIEVAR